MLRKTNRRVLAVLWAVPLAALLIVEQAQAQAPIRGGTIGTIGRGRPGVPHPAPPPLGLSRNPLFFHNQPPSPLLSPMQQQAMQQQQIALQQQQAYLNAMMQQQNVMLNPMQIQLMLQYQQLIALQQQNAVLTALQQQQLAALNMQVALWQQQQQLQNAAAAAQAKANAGK